MNNIQVESKSVNQEITHFTLDFISLVLHQSITFKINFYNNQNERIQKCLITLEGDEYNNWGTDDTYITNLICEKFSLTLKPIVPIETETQTETETKTETEIQ